MLIALPGPHFPFVLGSQGVNEDGTASDSVPQRCNAERLKEELRKYLEAHVT